MQDRIERSARKPDASAKSPLSIAVNTFSDPFRIAPEPAAGPPKNSLDDDRESDDRHNQDRPHNRPALAEVIDEKVTAKRARGLRRQLATQLLPVTRCVAGTPSPGAGEGRLVRPERSQRLESDMPAGRRRRHLALPVRRRGGGRRVWGRRRRRGILTKTTPRGVTTQRQRVSNAFSQLRRVTDLFSVDSSFPAFLCQMDWPGVEQKLFILFDSTLRVQLIPGIICACGMQGKLINTQQELSILHSTTGS